MKREYIILYVLLTLGLVALVSTYIANQSFKETLKQQEQERLQLQRVSTQAKISPIAARKRAKLKETNKPEAIAKKEEVFDLQQLPDDYVYVEEKGEHKDEDIESEEFLEEATSEESKLHIQPSADELRELKSKGIIIY